jgi:beta-ureidopropionase / N-carbamoyl-L-amino-acid hydrolase
LIHSRSADGSEVLRSLNDYNVKTPCPITVVNWTNEEGVRFKSGFTGSAGFVCGLNNVSVKGDGVDFLQELERIGYAGADNVKINVGAYYELHIEQGPVLERAGAQIGIVEGFKFAGTKSCLKDRTLTREQHPSWTGKTRLWRRRQLP